MPMLASRLPANPLISYVVRLGADRRPIDSPDVRASNKVILPQQTQYETGTIINAMSGGQAQTEWL